MEPPSLPVAQRRVPVPLVVLVATVVLVVLWPRLAPAPPPIPDERPRAVATATPIESAGPRTPTDVAPMPRQDTAGRAAQAPPGPVLGLGTVSSSGSAQRRGERRRAEQRRAGRRRNTRGRTRTRARRREQRKVAPAPAPVPATPLVPRTSGPRRRDAELLP